MKITQKILLFLLGLFVFCSLGFGDQSLHSQNFVEENEISLSEDFSITNVKNNLIHAINEGTLEDMLKAFDAVKIKIILTLFIDQKEDPFLHWIVRNKGSEQILYQRFNLNYLSPYIIKTLLLQRDKEGRTAKELAEYLQNTPMVKALSYAESLPFPTRYNFQPFLQAVKDENIEEYRRILRTEIPEEDEYILKAKLSELSYAEDEKGNNIFHYFISVKSFKQQFNQELLPLMALMSFYNKYNLHQALRKRNSDGLNPLDLARKLNNHTAFHILIKGNKFYKYMTESKNGLSQNFKDLNREDIKAIAKRAFRDEETYSSNEESQTPIDFIKNMEEKLLIQDKTAVLQMFQDLAEKPKDKILEVLKLQNDKGSNVFHLLAEATDSNEVFMNQVQEFQQKVRVPSLYSTFFVLTNHGGYLPTDVARIMESRCRKNFNARSPKRLEQKRQQERRRRDRGRARGRRT